MKLPLAALMPAVTLCFLTACATLEPDAITAEVAHESHATQHEPLTDHPTNYGRTELGLAARWSRGRFFGEVSEGYSFQGTDGSPAPREVFELKLGVDIWQRRS